MRSDYLAYLLAIVFFLIAATASALVADATEKTLWVLSTIILGLVSLGLGYYQRPKPKTMVAPSETPPYEPSDAHIRESHLAESVEKHSEPFEAPLTTTSIPMQEPTPTPVLAPGPAPTENVQPAETSAPVVEAPTSTENDLLTIKGINEKRATQLKALGINTTADLANASAEYLAEKLTISPKITRMWIGSARKLQKQTG